MSEAYDVCVIGSGAGGAPVAMALAEAGYSVCVLEKGPWYVREEFLQDEIQHVRRSMFMPDRRKDPHVWEKEAPDGQVHAWTTQMGWNGICVGGATTVMTGFFLRMRPVDFRQKSELGPIEGATVADWPISYEDLAPFYDRVEQEIGVSGRAVEHPNAEPRTGPFPQPALDEHPFAEHLDRTCRGMGLSPFPMPRAVLSRQRGDRRSCAYTGYCGSYGCPTGAKSGSLEALIPRALATGRLTLKSRAAAIKIESDATGRATAVEYVDEKDAQHRVEARVFVVAAQAIETARLLLLSPGVRHPYGLANASGLVGRNLLFSTYGGAWGDFPFDRYEKQWPWLRSPEPWVNRALQDWYVVDDPALGRRKGGTLNFLRMHPNPIAAAEHEAFQDEVPVWGHALKEKLYRYFRQTEHLKFEVFSDYTPTPEGLVMLDPHVRDRWGRPVARARVKRHPRDAETARFLTARGEEILRAMGAENVRAPNNVGQESNNLVAGTCRFGDDPRTSVLDRDCRAHTVDNLYVTDGSFMPSGGSVPYTFTIMANAFRVADRIIARFGGPRPKGPFLPPSEATPRRRP